MRKFIYGFITAMFIGRFLGKFLDGFFRRMDAWSFGHALGYHVGKKLFGEVEVNSRPSWRPPGSGFTKYQAESSLRTQYSTNPSRGATTN